MAQEMTLMEIGTRMSGLVFDPMARTMEIMSASAQVNNKLLQDALDVGAASIAAGRKLLETIQRNSLEAADAVLELGRVNAQGLIKMAESFQASLRTGRA
ncbi:MAG: hypothetical protein ACK4Z6_08365 [Candidatus Methylomirabilales bacterium]